MYKDINEIKEKHNGDIRTLWKIYQSEEKFYKNFFFKLSVGISITFILLSLLSSISTYSLITKVVDLSIGILPNLLGFNLGAYILVVGFGSTDILSVITKPLKGQHNFSFYQKLNSVLGVSVIIQIIALFITFFLTLWEDLQESNTWLINIKTCEVLPFLINVIVLFVLLVIIIYSFLLLINVVKHVFMFAQTIHLCVYQKRQKEDDNKTSV